MKSLASVESFASAAAASVSSSSLTALARGTSAGASKRVSSTAINAASKYALVAHPAPILSEASWAVRPSMKSPPLPKPVVAAKLGTLKPAAREWWGRSQGRCQATAL